ncbi:helix-turn-helix domain-containing protein [Parabacteroides bouchesdurhonensis]|uniref:helix-turn-helix domain-containing protein n=1 Tax=Parabacteroides bouchesdurhonensis TaxID=1936995 RepID=UPI000C835DA5
MSDQRWTKFTDCSSCKSCQMNVFKYRAYPRGMLIPQARCMQNTIYFLISGKVKVNSEEHPNTIFCSGEFILQPIGSRVEFQIIESCECILYLFERPLNICEDRFHNGEVLAANSYIQPVIMHVCAPLVLFLESMKRYLEDDMLCATFLQAKRSELVYILNCYYPLKELASFYAPIYRYSKSFEYFVMQNYLKVKDVESFAQLGGYSVPTFRRIFKETFGEPAYQWMIKKKCQDIHNDLTTTTQSISEICYKYGFESLANFSHFCRTNFGKSPRLIRNEMIENL